MARVAQSALSLDFIHVKDEGDDRVEGRSLRYSWKLKVTYEVGWNRKLEVVGTPQLVMAEQYRVPQS